MILQSIRVSGWRCFAAAVAVGPFQDGLNIIHGPNATGKSTLFEALRRGLLDGHRVGGREVEVIRPWGRELAPTVAVEFSHGGREYRITKRFLDRPSSLLERKENGRFVALAESGGADDMAREMLSGSAPAKGLSRRQNSGLAQVLWVSQGRLALEALSGDLVADISSSLRKQAAEPSAGPLERKIEEIYGRIYTPGGKYKTGKDAPPVVQLQNRLKAAMEERVEAAAAQREYEETARRVEDLRNRRAQARLDAEAISEKLKEARARADAFQKLTSERSERAARAGEEGARYNDLKRRIDDILNIKKEIAGITESLRRIESDLPLHERELMQREKEAAEAKSILEDIRKERPKGDAARALAEQARQFADNKSRLADLDEQLRKIDEAQQALNGLKVERAQCVSPDDKTLRAVRDAIKSRDEARLRVEASLITLEIVPEKDGKINVVAGEKPGEVDMRSGAPTRIAGSPEVVADLPGIARLRASGPAGSIEEHRAAHSKAERELKRLTEPFGTDTIEALESLLEKGRAIDARIKDAETRIETRLSGRKVEDMRRQHSEARAIHAKMLQDHPDWQDKTPDPSVLRAAADDIDKSFVGRVEKAESDLDKAKLALDSIRDRGSRLGSDAEAARKLKASLESRLAELEKDGKSDEQRAKELSEIAISWDAAKANLDKIAAELSEFKDNPVDTLSRLEKQLQAAEETAGRARDDEKTEEGRLQGLSARGTYSLLAAADEKVAELQSQFDAEELRAGAIRLLRDTLAECQAEAVAAVAGPVEAVATRIMQRIAGGRLGEVRLGEAFEPAGVVPDGGDAVPLESVSGGEREQIHLATRLALAEVLAGTERQMVVLDDVMVYTDTSRMARVLAVLEEEAQRLQIIILTCHPERYRGMEDARFVDLESLVRTTSAMPESSAD